MRLKLLLYKLPSNILFNLYNSLIYPYLAYVGLGGKFGAIRPEDRRFESNFSHHVGTLFKSFTRSYL